MNERIKELIKSMGIIPEDEHYEVAELLIKECANIARQTETDDSDDYKSGRTWASLDILEHFGV